MHILIFRCTEILHVVNTQVVSLYTNRLQIVENEKLQNQEDEKNMESDEKINDEYLDVSHVLHCSLFKNKEAVEKMKDRGPKLFSFRFQLQDQIISGSLPCPREEAALLASIQLCIEENWPSNKRTQTIRRHLLKGQFGERSLGRIRVL